MTHAVSKCNPKTWIKRAGKGNGVFSKPLVIRKLLSIAKNCEKTGVVSTSITDDHDNLETNHPKSSRDMKKLPKQLLASQRAIVEEKLTVEDFVVTISEPPLIDAESWFFLRFWCTTGAVNVLQEAVDFVGKIKTISVGPRACKSNHLLGFAVPPDLRLELHLITHQVAKDIDQISIIACFGQGIKDPSTNLLAASFIHSKLGLELLEP